MYIFVFYEIAIIIAGIFPIKIIKILDSNLLEFKLSQKSVDSSYSCPSPTMMQSTSHENALALGANGTSGIVTRSRIRIPSMGGLSTTTITIPPSNEVDQEDSALLVAFPAATRKAHGGPLRRI